MSGTRLVQLALVFGALSLVSFGGSNTVLPAMHRNAVTREQWLTDREFADVFAIAQAAPGPSSLVVSLIGYKAAGLAGALVATVALLGPSCLLMFVACRAWDRFHDTPWRVALERGLGPVTVGLVFASGLTITRAADHGVVGYAVTAVTALLLARTDLNPLALMAIAAALGACGLV